MSRPTLPALFLSHGSPMIALEPGHAGAFLRRLGPAIDATFGRPRAILAVSAHTLTRIPVLLSGERHEAVYDFGGFPPALYQLRYDAAGAPQLAPQVLGLLQQAGLQAQAVPEGGLDHGIWTALRYVYPQADVPILPLAWVPMQPPAEQFALGQALRALRDDGVLVLATGSITHNLRLLNRPGGRPEIDDAEVPESREFRDWMAARGAALDWPALFDYRAQAPHGALMHPTDEHLLPWYVAAGAGGAEGPVKRLHAGASYAFIGMDAYAFGEGAAALAEALG